MYKWNDLYRFGKTHIDGLVQNQFGACEISNATNYLDWSLEIHVFQAKGKQKTTSLQVYKPTRLNGVDWKKRER